MIQHFSCGCHHRHRYCFRDSEAHVEVKLHGEALTLDDKSWKLQNSHCHCVELLFQNEKNRTRGEQKRSPDCRDSFDQRQLEFMLLQKMTASQNIP